MYNKTQKQEIGLLQAADAGCDAGWNFQRKNVPEGNVREEIWKGNVRRIVTGNFHGGDLFEENVKSDVRGWGNVPGKCLGISEGFRELFRGICLKGIYNRQLLTVELLTQLAELKLKIKKKHTG